MSLFIDTCNYRLIVAIIDEKNNKILTIHNEKISGDLSYYIFTVIDDLISAANITPNDIEKVYSVVGPGSFTGIRIGVTISKTFAWAKKIKCVPISSLEVLASTDVHTDYVVPMIDARRACVYAGIYDRDLNPVLEDSYISLESLSNNLHSDRSYTFVSDDNIDYFADTIESNVDLLKLINKHKSDEGVNPHILNPIYLKMTEAEANRLSKEHD